MGLTLPSYLAIPPIREQYQLASGSVPPTQSLNYPYEHNSRLISRLVLGDQIIFSTGQGLRTIRSNQAVFVGL